jgi:hypothetical protein
MRFPLFALNSDLTIFYVSDSISLISRRSKQTKRSRVFAAGIVIKKATTSGRIWILKYGKKVK